MLRRKVPTQKAIFPQASGKVEGLPGVAGWDYARQARTPPSSLGGIAAPVFRNYEYETPQDALMKRPKGDTRARSQGKTRVSFDQTGRKKLIGYLSGDKNSFPRAKNSAAKPRRPAHRPRSSASVETKRSGRKLWRRLQVSFSEPSGDNGLD